MNGAYQRLVPGHKQPVVRMDRDGRLGSIIAPLFHGAF